MSDWTAKKWVGFFILVIVVSFGASQCARYAVEQQNMRESAAASSSPVNSLSESNLPSQQKDLPPESAFFVKSLDGGVSVSLPKNWRWMSQVDSQALNTETEALLDETGTPIGQGNNQILLAGNAVDHAQESVATVRISMRFQGDGTQAQLRDAVETESVSDLRSMVISELNSNADTMRRLPHMKYYNVSDGGIKENGRLICIWSKFDLDAGKGPTILDSWICPLGNRTLKLTTSYRKNRSNLFASTMEKVWRSLSVGE